jgi:hypothetical protein
MLTTVLEELLGLADNDGNDMDRESYYEKRIASRQMHWNLLLFYGSVLPNIPHLKIRQMTMTAQKNFTITGTAHCGI